MLDPSAGLKVFGFLFFETVVVVAVFFFLFPFPIELSLLNLLVKLLAF